MTFDTDLRQQLESGPVAHLIGGLSAPLDLTFVSSEVEVLTGYGPERFLGDCSFLMGRVHPEDESEVSRALEQLASAERLDFDFRFRHADGIWRRLRASFEPLSGADGQSSQIVGSLRDITPRKEIERALLQMEERLRV
ncbi:MAG: PAS domain-containing protein, partial [Gammaproteobacteria bacterium]|nr:PAS domain-containing protein [Gammaproteobacteria bacterium]